MPTQDTFAHFTLERAESSGLDCLLRMRLGATALTPLNPSHAPLITSWMNDAALYVNMGDIDARPFTLRDGERYVDAHLKDTWIIMEERVGGAWAPVGYSGIFVRSRHRTGIFRIAVGGKNARGKGHGRRATKLMLGWAFNELDLHSVHLSVSASNTRAASLYREVGFRECGRYRESRWEGGSRQDEVLMEILKDEYIRS